MRYVVVIAAVLAIGSSQEIIAQLQGTLSKLSLPEAKLTKLTEVITKTAKDCLVKSADGMTAEQSQTVVDFAMPAFHDCGDKVKEVPADEVDRREILLKACMAEKLAKSALDDSQKAFMGRLKACFMTARAPQQ